MTNRKSSLQGFSKLTLTERYQRLQEIGILDHSAVHWLQNNKHPAIDLAEKLIENVIGYHALPLGVATHFCIDDKNYVIPMAVEETSIIAAASKTAKWIQQCGCIITETLGLEIIGQIQIAKVKNLQQLKKIFAEQQNNLIQELNCTVASAMVNRGGGVTRMELRTITRPDNHAMAIIHVMANVCDAMGANIMNQICEYLKTPIESLTQEKVTMCILSNLADTRLTRAIVQLENIDAELGEKIQEASYFAELDPYRAATNNKGVLNGIDAVLIATGNDWRAVEAGMHAYAARSGQYRSLTEWRYQNNILTGKLIAPIIVGTIGGITQIHPTAKIALAMLGKPNANELARIIAAVGLVQNLGALRALTTVGIIEGHMKLHISNLSLSAGATVEEIPLLEERLKQVLFQQKRISLSHAVAELKRMREGVSS